MESIAASRVQRIREQEAPELFIFISLRSWLTYPRVQGRCPKSHSQLVVEAAMPNASLLNSNPACLLLHLDTLKMFRNTSVSPAGNPVLLFLHTPRSQWTGPQGTWQWLSVPFPLSKLVALREEYTLLSWGLQAKWHTDQVLGTGLDLYHWSFLRQPWRPGGRLLSGWFANGRTLLQLCQHCSRLRTPRTWGFIGNTHSSSPWCSPILLWYGSRALEGAGKTVRKELPLRKSFLLSIRKLWWWYYYPKALLEGPSSHSPKVWIRKKKEQFSIIMIIFVMCQILSWVLFIYYIYSPQ